MKIVLLVLGYLVAGIPAGVWYVRHLKYTPSACFVDYEPDIGELLSFACSIALWPFVYAWFALRGAIWLLFKGAEWICERGKRRG